jgi:hypothetical protein
LDAIVSFCIPCLLFSVWSLQVECFLICSRMFLVCFRFLLCLGCSFIIVGDTYILFTGSVVLASSLVRGLLVLFVCLGFVLWGPGGVVHLVGAFSLVWSLLFSFV